MGTGEAHGSHVCSMLQMTIHEVGVRKAILREIARYNEHAQRDEERAAAKLKGLELDDNVRVSLSVLVLFEKWNTPNQQ